MPADHAPLAGPARVRTHGGFRLFWTASTVSDFGSQIITLAIRPLSPITHGWTQFYAVLGAGIGGLVGSRLSERLGRRPGRAVLGALLASPFRHARATG